MPKGAPSTPKVPEKSSKLPYIIGGVIIYSELQRQRAEIDRQDHERRESEHKREEKRKEERARTEDNDICRSKADLETISIQQAMRDQKLNIPGKLAYVHQLGHDAAGEDLLSGLKPGETPKIAAERHLMDINDQSRQSCMTQRQQSRSHRY